MISIYDVEREYPKQKMLQRLFRSIISRNSEKASEYVSAKISKYNNFMNKLKSNSREDAYFLSEVTKKEYISSLNFCSVLTDEEKSFLKNYFIGYRRNFLKELSNE